MRHAACDADIECLPLRSILVVTVLPGIHKIERTKRCTNVESWLPLQVVKMAHAVPDNAVDIREISWPTVIQHHALSDFEPIQALLQGTIRLVLGDAIEDS